LTVSCSPQNNRIMNQKDKVPLSRLFPEIMDNSSLGAGFFRLSFHWNPSIPLRAGQFVTFRISPRPVPLLRRPFAFSGFSPAAGEASIIVKRRGTATDMLSRMKTGERLDILGPLGNWFPEPEPGREAVLLAGGIGLGPLLFFARQVRAAGRKATLVFGCRTAKELPVLEELENADTVICTDDGSAGFAGTVVDYFQLRIPRQPEAIEVYACGPSPMLKATAEYADRSGMRCWVSMEQVMGCAMGACMGCVIPVKSGSGYARVCREGPVFDSREIIWT
jgi:dihydroorotate dehydrogenase electron transfer subunit